MDVLLVDDDDDVRNVYRRTLEHAGFSVTGVDNGLAAIAELYQEGKVGVILCDQRMPFLDGDRFYDELTTALPVVARRMIFVTGVDDRTMLRKLAQTGQPVLRKPVELVDLLTAVRTMVDRD